MRVLIVDDDADIRQMVSFLLRAPGIEVVGESSNGEEAVAAVEELHPDLVVMDLMMPILDGVEATRRIREAHPDIKVIGFTAVDDGADRFMAAGAMAVIQKSQFSSLLDVLDRWPK